MQTKEGMTFPTGTEKQYKTLLINMIYKLLPIREEGKDWEKDIWTVVWPRYKVLITSLKEIDGLHLVRILSKLESLKTLTEEDDFYLYRKTILECTNLVD